MNQTKTKVFHLLDSKDQIPPGEPEPTKLVPLDEVKTQAARNLATWVDEFANETEVSLQLGYGNYKKLMEAVHVLYRINREGIYTLQTEVE